MSRFNELYGERFRKLSSTNVSDALDALGIHGSTCGIRPMAERWTKIVGPAVTMRRDKTEDAPGNECHFCSGKRRCDRD